MSTRERILMIRLLEKVTKHPAYAEALGIEGAKVNICTDNRTNSNSTGKSRKQI